MKKFNFELRESSLLAISTKVKIEGKEKDVAIGLIDSGNHGEGNYLIHCTKMYPELLKTLKSIKSNLKKDPEKFEILLKNIDIVLNKCK